MVEVLSGGRSSQCWWRFKGLLIVLRAVWGSQGWWRFSGLGGGQTEVLGTYPLMVSRTQ